MIRALLNGAGLALGVLFAIFACGLVYLLATGAVKEGSGGATVVAAACLLGAAPLLAHPFAPRAAGVLFAVDWVAFALGMLWAAFLSNASTPSLAFQVAAVAFALLSLWRAHLAWRKRVRGAESVEAPRG